MQAADNVQNTPSHSPKKIFFFPLLYSKLTHIKSCATLNFIFFDFSIIYPSYHQLCAFYFTSLYIYSINFHYLFFVPLLTNFMFLFCPYVAFLSKQL